MGHPGSGSYSGHFSVQFISDEADLKWRSACLKAQCRELQLQNSAMAMNVVVTSHQPVYLYSLTGEEGKPPKHAYWLNGGSANARNILIVF
jgi:hypothetical protein